MAYRGRGLAISTQPALLDASSGCQIGIFSPIPPTSTYDMEVRGWWNMETMDCNVSKFPSSGLGTLAQHAPVNLTFLVRYFLSISGNSTYHKGQTGVYDNYWLMAPIPAWRDNLSKISHLVYNLMDQKDRRCQSGLLTQVKLISSDEL